MVGNAVTADMQLMNAAMNHRRLRAAEIASSTHRFRRLFCWTGGRCGLQQASLEIKSSTHTQRSKGDEANAGAEDCLVLFLCERGWNECEPKQD